MVRTRYFKSELNGKVVELFESSHPARAISEISEKKRILPAAIITQIPEDVYRELQYSQAVAK
ncbi:hypothetical protein N6H13_25915 [Paenibacillus sp. CC-CFT742]|nr:hypothetical protein [Paenibacillus sp. CC-CFT742]WJH28432.1 hypothetical protein N6H13_25915 [Paenibacillus sp. CC-CFT742]